MNNSKKQLQELIKLITRSILKEYSVMSSSNNDEKNNANDNTDPTKELTPYEKSKLEREKRQQQELDLKKKKLELDAEKKQKEFYRQKINQSTRYNIPQMTKDVQALQGAKI